MRVHVKLFATLGKYNLIPGLPGTPFEMDLFDGACLGDLLQQLDLPQELVKITFVNGIVQPLEWKLKAGDDVGIFPPIGGG
jgi:molybdopterin synthase sulfur carrier subunit